MMKHGLNKPSGSRSKSLNIIYFIDSNRTHYIQFRLKTALVLAGLVIAISLWTIGGTIWLSQEISASAKKTHHIHQLNRAIFEYQAKHENLYEKTYPEHIPSRQNPEKVAKEKSALDSERPSISVDNGREDAKPQKQVLAGKATPENIEKSMDSPKSRTVALNGKEKPAEISVENVTYNIEESGLTLKFAIRNQDSPERVDGHIWGLASLSGDPNLVSVSSPKGINEETEPAVVKTKAPRFSIRYFKNKLLYFPLPSKTAKFDRIAIYYSNSQRHHHLKTVDINNEKGPLAKNIMP